MVRDRPDYPIPERFPQHEGAKAQRGREWRRGITLLVWVVLLFAVMDVLFFNQVLRSGPHPAGNVPGSLTTGRDTVDGN